MLASGGQPGYNAAMRRKLGFGAGLCLLLLALCSAAYAAYWQIVAKQILREVGAGARQGHGGNYAVSWGTLHVSGFPTMFRLEGTALSLTDERIKPAPVLHIPVLSGVARPWDPRIWHLVFRQGLEGEIAGGTGRPPMKIGARSATGAVAVDPSGRATLWLRLAHAVAEEGGRIDAKHADAWILLPKDPAGSARKPPVGMAVRLSEVRLPAAVAPLGRSIRNLFFGLRITGTLASGPIEKAVSAWRQSGGRIKVQHLRLRWGALGATASGTMTLDHNLQPAGGFSGTIEGYDHILAALVASGRMTAQEGMLGRLALTFLAKVGSDGRPQIATSFKVKNGQIYLGPARLGPAPRINWQ